MMLHEPGRFGGKQQRPINGVVFQNRVIRSSIGGRTAYYDGTVNDAWETFESAFAKGGVGGIISATLTVDDNRWSPLEYPKISHDKFVEPLRTRIRRIRRHFPDLKYIIQIGDPGYHTQTSLVTQAEDSMSASSGFDFLYGYTNVRRELSVTDIKRTIANFREAARRVVDTGCDGLELTASKGYLIHQFLNPGTNGRTDEYGGPLERRARLLQEIVENIRDVIKSQKTCEGRFIFGVRLSARDYNRHPWMSLFRLGPGLKPSALSAGNSLDDMLEVGAWLKTLGVDYLHISAGFGFINPHENPGEFPTDEVRMFCDSTRHLSFKARARAKILANVPHRLSDYLMNLGWAEPNPAVKFANITPPNLDDARAFSNRVGIPVIVNGGFQLRAHIEDALRDCDFVSMARPLLANPQLLRMLYDEDKPIPDNPCTFCNKCAVRTTMFPLGCYDVRRFCGDEQKMNAQIVELNVPGSHHAVVHT
jgi:2,4-dienoyl-CoA reductase-like NADH-dependent reductase (Old Yellow Enzyme family)